MREMHADILGRRLFGFLFEALPEARRIVVAAGQKTHDLCPLQAVQSIIDLLIIPLIDWAGCVNKRV